MNQYFNIFYLIIIYLQFIKLFVKLVVLNLYIFVILFFSLQEGNGSGNNSSESSSQTDNDEEIRNRLLETDVGNIARGETNVIINNSATGEITITSETQSEPMTATSVSEYIQLIIKHFLNNNVV